MRAIICPESDDEKCDLETWFLQILRKVVTNTMFALERRWSRKGSTHFLGLRDGPFRVVPAQTAVDHVECTAVVILGVVIVSSEKLRDSGEKRYALARSAQMPSSAHEYSVSESPKRKIAFRG